MSDVFVGLLLIIRKENAWSKIKKGLALLNHCNDYSTAVVILIQKIIKNRPSVPYYNAHFTKLYS
jgi:hypothetical protein